LERLRGKHHSEDLDVDGRIILKRILGNWRVQMRFIWLRIDRWRALVDKITNLRTA
jgi:hypothetical protein